MTINRTEKSTEIVGNDSVTQEQTKVPASSLGLSVDSPTTTTLLKNILTELRIGNAYLAMLTGEEITKSDIKKDL